MPFLILCAVLAFIVQFFVLRVSLRRHVRLLAFALLELPALLAVFYYAIVQPHVFGLYIAGAVLLGCVCAWLAELLRKPR